MAKVVVHCAACGTSIEKFPVRLAQYAYHFCSPACRKTPCIPLTCCECGKSFLATVYTYQESKFCSTDCAQARNRREEVHKKGVLVAKACERCGKPYHVRSSVAKVQRFCSRKCWADRGGPRLVGPKNPKWKPKVVITCAYCGVEFTTFPSRAARRKYCCKEHRHLGNLQRLAINHRTNLEVAMADALRQHGITFEEQITLVDRFMVDFLLPASRIVIQCDGLYWHDRPHVRHRDRGQDRYLAQAGYIVLRFTDNQILHEMPSCIKSIRQTINSGQFPLLSY
jgi:very-short-patch-repair endonuclease